MVLKSDTDELILSFSFKINAFPHLRDHGGFRMWCRATLDPEGKGKFQPSLRL